MNYQIETNLLQLELEEQQQQLARKRELERGANLPCIAETLIDFMISHLPKLRN